MPTWLTKVDRPFQVTQRPARSRFPPPKESPQARTDICYNSNKPGHFAAHALSRIGHVSADRPLLP